jgi:hypothetical protein
VTTILRRAGRLVSVLAIVLILLATTVSSPAVTSPLLVAELQPVHQPAPGVAVETHPAQTQVASARAVRRLDQVSERAHVAVSVLDEESGATFDHGSGRFETASLVKIHLVALMSWRAAKSGVRLTAAQRRDAERMLVRSDNDAALREYYALGGRDGIEHGLASAYGTTGVRVGDLGYWGHSSTTPRDVVTLLGRVLDPDAEKTYALMQDAMTRVVPSQRWGISVLADRGSAVQTKVGWFEDPDGWIVNSSGRVVVDGSPVLISVMTDRNPTLESGIKTIEEVARLAGDVVRERRNVTRRPWLDLGARIAS